MSELMALTSEKNPIHYRRAIITFEGFEEYKAQAEQIAEYIRSVELTEDNIKDVKRDIAAARKVTDGLDRKRKDLRSEILANYKVFEDQIKELQGIITEAESVLREKVKAMEEAERDAKREKIRDIWNSRTELYTIESVQPDAFDLFLTPQHLNKTVSMKSVESDMVSWLEQKETDLDNMRALGEDYVIEFTRNLNATEAIRAVRDRQAIKDHLVADEETEETATFIITGKANITLTEMLLKQHGITWRKK